MKSLSDRFSTKVAKSDGCWLWTGQRGHGGYGYLRRGSDGQTETRAHRISWLLAFGPIPTGLWVLHRCDNPPCVRPEHLFLGDRRINMLDAAAKGRICTIGKGRMTHCMRGHEFTADNTYRDGEGHRRCITCVKAYRKGLAPRIRALEDRND